MPSSPIEAELTPEAAVKELARLIRTHVVSLERQHHMINLLTSLSSTLYNLREDVRETRDALAEALELAGK